MAGDNRFIVIADRKGLNRLHALAREVEAIDPEDKRAVKKFDGRPVGGLDRDVAMVPLGWCCAAKRGLRRYHGLQK